MQGFPFVVSCVAYSTLALLAFWRYSRNHAKKTAIDRAVATISGTNATLATVLSSLTLLYMTPEQRLDMYGPKTSPLAGWIIEGICGYILVELLFLVFSGCRLNRPKDVSFLINEYFLMEVFHIVAFVGLTSVLFLGTGYPLAMWQIWTELTTVFIVIEETWSLNSWQFRRYLPVADILSFLSKLTCIVFVSQRVLLCLFLTLLSCRQFPWTLFSAFQLSILVIGTIINAVLAVKTL